MSEARLLVEPERRVAARHGGEIARVAKQSPAARGGLRPGDWLVAINGLVVRDLIDYSYEGAVRNPELVVERNGHLERVRISKGPDEELGLEFTLPVFSGIRECNNNCDFCFIAALPKGLRRSLYIRDDDYRYSFLFGTFLTLTNLDQADWERIGFQRLSPLHISVHASDLAVRRRMLRNPEAPDILTQLARLGALGVQVKCQVVLCPGVNDGGTLERTVRDLAELADTVDSVAVVPVGLTRYSRRDGLRALTSAEACSVVGQARRWQRNLRRRLGRGFVYLSDEIYVLAGAPLPPARSYDGYRQLQNGVGLTRLLHGEWARLLQSVPACLEAPRIVAWVCGQAAASALRRMAADLDSVEGLDLEVVVIENHLFGGGITVSGLLAGRDIAAGLRGVNAHRAVLPRAAFGFEGQQTLDGWSPERIRAEAGVPIALAGSASDLLEVTLRGDG